jgi:hypothetical protein
MMARVVQLWRAAKEAEARIADSIVGDAIGAICGAVGVILLVIGAGVLQ